MATSTTPSTASPNPLSTILGASAAAVTTEFTQPPGCSTILDVLHLATYMIPNSGMGTAVNSEIAVPVVVSYAGNPKFSACQPSGWENQMSGYAMYFSPAVPPSGWTGRVPVATRMGSRTVTEMWCCKDGYDNKAPGSFLGSLSIIKSLEWPCISMMNSVQDETSIATHTEGPQSGLTTLITAGIFMHPPWKIAWESSDLDILTPRPFVPTTKDYQISTSTTSNQTYSAPSFTTGPAPRRGTGISGSGFPLVLAVGFPLVFLFIVAASCCTYRIKQRRTKAGLATRAVALQAVSQSNWAESVQGRGSEAHSYGLTLPARGEAPPEPPPPAYATTSPPRYRES